MTNNKNNQWEERFWYSFLSDDMRPVTYPKYIENIFYCTGYTADDRCTMICWVEAKDVSEVEKFVKKFYPEAEERFCEEVDFDFKPSDRFPEMRLFKITNHEKPR